MPQTQYSSFQIAKMLNVSRQAVNQWIDKGFIESYRTPGGHRRVARKDLISFLSARSIPIPTDLSGEAPRSKGDGYDIVFIDDDKDFMFLISQAIADTIPNVRVRQHVSAMDGLIAIGAQQPNLLLVDMMMPEMNGVEVIRRVKANELTARVPILVLTALDEGPELQAARKMQIEKVISKATPVAKIAAEIAHQLRHSPAMVD